MACLTDGLFIVQNSIFSSVPLTVLGGKVVERMQRLKTGGMLEEGARSKE